MWNNLKYHLGFASEAYLRDRLSAIHAEVKEYYDPVDALEYIYPYMKKGRTTVSDVKAVEERQCIWKLKVSVIMEIVADVACMRHEWRDTLNTALQEEHLFVADKLYDHDRAFILSDLHILEEIKSVVKHVRLLEHNSPKAFTPSPTKKTASKKNNAELRGFIAGTLTDRQLNMPCLASGAIKNLAGLLHHETEFNNACNSLKHYNEVYIEAKVYFMR